MAVKRNNSRSGELLVGAGIITAEQLEAALKEQRKNEGEPLCAFLDRLGLVPQEKSLPILAREWGIPYLSLKGNVGMGGVTGRVMLLWK